MIYWSYQSTYPNHNVLPEFDNHLSKPYLGEYRLLEVTQLLVVPADARIKFLMTSADVWHLGFYICYLSTKYIYEENRIWTYVILITDLQSAAFNHSAISPVNIYILKF